MQDIMFQIVTFVKRCFQIDLIDYVCSSYTVNEITAVHRSLSSTISCVTDRIRFLPVTHDLQVFKFQWYISYTEDRHELRMAGTGEIFISGAAQFSECKESNLFKARGF